MPNKTSLKNQTTIASCAFAVNATSEIQLLPAGEFRASDGRPHDVAAWLVNAEIADANSATSNGWYHTGLNTANIPLSAYGILVSLMASPLWGRQIWYFREEFSIYTRYCNNGSWSNWVKLPVGSGTANQFFLGDGSIVSGADAFAAMGANQSLSANGYQKLPGGLIIQWGTTLAAR